MRVYLKSYSSAKCLTGSEESSSQYFYHSDHLGSASLISDCDGNEYQRIEYTPYGEIWVEKTENNGLAYLPYKFTGKEMDEETGLYYYGARYLDPKYSRWISTDPALGEYIPKAPINDDAKRYNQNLPGMGGIFNHTNAGLFHYAGNNPVRYIDPDGRRTMTAYEKKFAREILGNAAPLNTNVYKNFSDDGSFSPPLGFVLIQKTLYSDSMTRGEQLSVLMHELFHQVQYIKNPIEVKIYAGLPFEFSAGVSVSLSGHSIGISANARARVSAFVGISASIGVFPSLAYEFVIDEFMGIVSEHKGKGYVYKYGDLSQYNTLSDFPYLESQAEMVGDFAYFYYQERYGIGIENEQKVNMKRMAEILKNSGYKSEAIKWVLERY